MERRAGRDLPPEVYTRGEVQRLLDGPLGRNEKTRTRNRALLVVMWRAGLRGSEALDLRMEDLRSEEGGVWGRRGAGGKPRLAGMDHESFEALGPWPRASGPDLTRSRWARRRSTTECVAVTWHPEGR